MLFAKVRPHDVGVSDHRLGIAVGDLAPGDENGDAFGEFHDGAHHVLDHDDGDALLLQPEDEREAEAYAAVRRLRADVAPLEADAALVVPERAGEAVHERALARAVRADEADAL